MGRFSVTPRTERHFDHYVGTDPESGERFLFFWKTQSVFSQWYPSPFEQGGHRFTCAEQWMMALKAHVFEDDDTLRKILSTPDPARHKALGRTVHDFREEHWDDRSGAVVYIGNFLKFRGTLKSALDRTEGFTLVEASPLDTVWGIGLADDHPDAYCRSTWRGENRLGHVLTELREDMRANRAEERARQLLLAFRVDDTTFRVG